MSYDEPDRNLPVSFCFLVTFQNRQGKMFSASFSEVRGIGWEVTTKTTREFGVVVEAPDRLKPKQLVLVRPLEALSEDLSDWLDTCARLMAFPSGTQYMLKYNTCDVVVKLLDSEGQPRAAWSFDHAYPSAYSLGDLKAAESSLAIETITLTCNGLGRVV